MKQYIGIARTLFKYYQKIPQRFRWLVWLIPILYWIMPADFLPDIFLGIGKIDDIALVLVCFWLWDKFKAMNKVGENDLGQGKQAQKKAAHTESDDPYTVLGVAHDADPETCRKAYRELLKAYHPDKFNHLGPDFEAIARQKTEAVIAAYQKISGEA